MPKFITVEEAVKLIPDGATVMFGGFMGCGNAHKFIDALSKSGVKDLTMISNDASMPGGPMGEDYYGVAKLVHNKQIKKLIATHVRAAAVSAVFSPPQASAPSLKTAPIASANRRLTAVIICS